MVPEAQLNGCNHRHLYDSNDGGGGQDATPNDNHPLDNLSLLDMSRAATPVCDPGPHGHGIDENTSGKQAPTAAAETDHDRALLFPTDAASVLSVWDVRRRVSFSETESASMTTEAATWHP